MSSHDKIISFAIPCYNAAEYMDHCVETLLGSAGDYLERIEIVLVDDGSNEDTTAQKADEWQTRHPSLIRALHQENGGHGEAVNTGLSAARGAYFKVIDADDWVDVDAAHSMIAQLAAFLDQGQEVDLLVVNYVYEKVLENKRVPIRYTGIFPEGRIFGWSDVGRFGLSQNLIMHAVVYRTQFLRATGLRLPRHTFYVDNIFVYVPLPSVKSIYYLNVDLYRYFIGREGQSVNEKTMASRVDQQLGITRILIESHDLAHDIPDKGLQNYMVHFLTMMLVICSVFLLLNGRPEAIEQREQIWAHLKEHNPDIYPRMRKSFLGRMTNLKGKWGTKVIIVGYHLAQKLFKFN
jgi:glycosyltransferase involved in cell wall biosynthesis